MEKPNRIIVSRTDSIGDSVLTLPLCGQLKSLFPEVEVVYYGKSYVKDVVMQSSHIDEFLTFNESSSLGEIVEQLLSVQANTIIHVFPRKLIAHAAKKARITNRIGTGGRLYHFTTCNMRVQFSRKRSDLHEAQLNLKLLKPFGFDEEPGFEQLQTLYGVRHANVINDKQIILHPGSRGSAVDWPLEHFVDLANKLIDEGYEVHLTGTEEEGQSFRSAFSFGDRLVDHSGQMNLSELIEFIKTSKALVACSTGPLHVAAMLGVQAIGLFVDIRPIHPGRWAPIGQNAHVLTPKVSKNRESIADIKPEAVLRLILGADYTGTN